MSKCDLNSQILESSIKESNTNNEMGQIKSKVKKNSPKIKEKICKTVDHDFMCGVVEGFYGRPWTTEQRLDLFKRMKTMGLNTYLYGPKDDYKHRLFWREKYSPDESDLLKRLISEANAENVTFVYAISPGLDMVFTAEKEIKALENKLQQVKELGCSAFALLFDDIDPVLCSFDRERYESSAHAQAAITNTMYESLGCPRFLFCPTEYCNNMATPSVETSQYLQTLGKTLHPDISVMWTGPKVVSNVISVESIQTLNEILQRKVMIWDNLHANDYDPKRVFFGPYKGRSTELIPLLSGVLTNPNCEFESNFVALHTLASWWLSCGPPSDDKKTEIKKEETVDQEVSSSSSSSCSSADDDSDYSSRGSLQPNSLFNHGNYDPIIALNNALRDWLPLFSYPRFITTKIIARSGTAISTSMPPPIVSSPPSVISCSSSLLQPIVCPSLTGDIIAMDSSEHAKHEDDVKVTSSTDIEIASNASCDVTNDAFQPEVDKEEGDDVTAATTSVDMKEDPLEEVMQTDVISIAKNSQPMQIDAESESSSLAAMQTDEVSDSDVSMATASGAAPTPSDVIEPSCDVMEDSPLPVEDAKEEVPEVAATTSDCSLRARDSDDDVMLPRNSIEAVKERDLQVLADCFHLPYEHGQIGRELISAFKWLKEHAAKLSRDKSNRKSDEYLTKALKWTEKATRFDSKCQMVLDSFKRVITCPNRTLLYDIFPYISDMRGVINMLRSYIKWLGKAGVNVKDCDQNELKDKSPPISELGNGYGWLSSDPEPWVFRGGLSGEFQRLLPVSASFDLFCHVVPVEPQANTYVVRPYLATDEEKVLQICYSTSEVASADFFADYQQLPGDRFVGGLLTLSPKYAFVVEDEDCQVCGYLAAALDARRFWTKYEMAYLPALRLKYPSPPDDNLPAVVKEMIEDLHGTEKRFEYGSDKLMETYPSLLTFALTPNSHQNIVKNLMVCVLSALKSHNSSGVHVLVENTSLQSIDLYNKLGFVKIPEDQFGTESVLEQKGLQAFGRTF